MLRLLVCVRSSGGCDVTSSSSTRFQCALQRGTGPGVSCDVIIINTFPVRLTEGGQALVPRAFCRGTVDFICDTTSVGSTSCNLSLVARFILYIH